MIEDLSSRSEEASKEEVEPKGYLMMQAKENESRGTQGLRDCCGFDL